jgi:hypothetical protein
MTGLLIPNPLGGLRMAIDLFFLDVLRKAPRNGAKTACLGYPDIVVDRRQAEAMLGKPLRESPNAETLRNWHRLPKSMLLADTESVMEALGCAPTYFDVNPQRGCEVALDLNDPLPPQWVNAFDFLIDTGTIEHCFNVGQAFKSMCTMVRPGGVVVTMLPMTNINHGFWNVCPTALYDGFTQNGWTVTKLAARWKKEERLVVMDFLEKPQLRAKNTPNEGVLICVAQRTADQPWRWPVQSKYVTAGLAPPSP